VELGNDLNWNHHIDQTTTKANGILTFLRRNLNKCSKEVKEKALPIAVLVVSVVEMYISAPGASI
jgi:hypothetical protein